MHKYIDIHVGKTFVGCVVVCEKQGKWLKAKTKKYMKNGLGPYGPDPHGR